MESLTTPSTPDWNKMKVDELKAELKKRGLKVSGNKSELIERLGGIPERSSDAKRKATEGETKNSPKKTKVKTYPTYPGVDDADFVNTDGDDLRATMKIKTNSYHRMVDNNWHDGYEDQEEYLDRVTTRLNANFQSIINLASFAANGPSDFANTGISRAHDALFALRDGWASICSVPARGGVPDWCGLSLHIPVIGEDGTKSTKEKKEGRMSSVFNTTWKFLLLSACSSDQIGDDLINRIIKDGSDYGIEVLNFDPKDHQILLESEVYKKGFDRLKVIYEKNNWKELPSNKIDHKEKKVADARFETPIFRRKKGSGKKGRKKEDCSIQ